MKAKIKAVNELIDFGELKGQSFIEIYKFNYTYIEWLIRETEICFTDLDDFFMYGNPFDIQYKCLTYETREVLFSHITKNNRLSKNYGRRINFLNIKYLKDLGLINYKDLHEFDYKFTNDIIIINKNKFESVCRD